jgi:hypothetical protein
MSLLLYVAVAVCRCGCVSLWLCVAVAVCRCGCVSLWLCVAVAVCRMSFCGRLVIEEGCEAKVGGGEVKFYDGQGLATLPHQR